MEIYELDPTKFLSAPGLACKVELELLADISMLLMVEKEIRGGICHSINRYEKANNKYMMNYYKNEEISYLKYWDVNNLYGWSMSGCSLLIPCSDKRMLLCNANFCRCTLVIYSKIHIKELYLFYRGDFFS